MTTQRELEAKIFETAKKILDENGLQHWGVQFDNSYRRLGQCDFSKQVISFSRRIAPIISWEENMNTILHEVAHAIAGYRAKHDEQWKSVARGLGLQNVEDKVQLDVTKIDPWVGTCAEGHSVTMARPPQRVKVCIQCADIYGASTATMVHWTKHGKEHVMPRRYQVEYAKVLAHEAKYGSDFITVS